MALSSFPAFSGKCTPSAGRCFLVFLVSVLGVCVSVYYQFTPGIPFDRNLFAALGMLPGAILCALLLLLPCGGWPSWLFHTLLCAVIAPIFCYFRGMNIDIFPAAVWGALLGASISYPLFTFFNTLKDRAEKDSGKDSQRPVSDEMSAPKK